MMSNIPTPDFFAVDLDHLDEQWREQGKLTAQFGFELADAKKDHAHAERNKELTKAKLGKDVRTNPSVFGLEKVTESAIENVIIIQEAYQKAYTEMIEADHRVDVLKTCMVGMANRKTSLENEVILFCAGYFGSPKSPKGIPREMVDEFKRAYLKGKTTNRRGDNDE